MNGIPSPLFFGHYSSTPHSKKSIQSVKHVMGPPRVGGGYHPIVCIEKHFLNLQPPMLFLSLLSSIVTSPDHHAHQICRLVAAAVIKYSPKGKILRDHFIKPLRGFMLIKLHAEIQGIPDDKGDSVMCWR